MAPEDEGNQSNQVITPKGEPILRKVEGYGATKETGIPKQVLYRLNNGILLKIPNPEALVGTTVMKIDKDTYQQTNYYLTADGTIVAITRIEVDSRYQSPKISNREEISCTAQIVGVDGHVELSTEDPKNRKATLTYNPQLPEKLAEINQRLMSNLKSNRDETPGEIIID